MSYTPDQIERFREMAEKGKCPECDQTVAFNQYGISATMLETLKALAKITNDQLENGGNRNVDVRVSGLDHNHRSTLSKLRQHALIAKVKDGKLHVAGHWVVTTTGWAFLAGAEVKEKVEVYNNTVLGHVGGTTNRHIVETADKAANDPDLIKTEKVSTAEAKALGSLREKPLVKTIKHRARYLLKDYRALGLSMTGKEFDIELLPLQTGKPVVMVKPQHNEYKDISSFRRAWEIIR